MTPADPALPVTQDDRERWLDAMATLHGLVIDAAQRPGVLDNLARLAEQYALLADFDLESAKGMPARFEP
jgi:hypothetical protein